MERNLRRTNVETWKYSFQVSLPVMAGYIVLGMGFGILLQSKGYSWGWAVLMSGFIYAGSMQYVTIDLLTGGASLIAAAIMTLMVNLRHIFYGLTMLEHYKDTGAKKPYLIFALTDETFSLVCSPKLPENVDRKKYYFQVSVLNQFYWVLGTILGGILGNAIAFNSTGVDFSMTALFVVIFMEQWEKKKNHLPALTGVVISVFCLLFFGATDFLIPAMTGITAVLFIERRWIKEEV
ncbi:MAG: AzlC family ABC transporter permease [Schaedlerella sp.]|nr:AzlC family ABC transporter permease [Schaedlerella sp.]